MTYIKFRISNETFTGDFKRKTAKISRIDSDMATPAVYDLPLILHALSFTEERNREEYLAYSFPFNLGRPYKRDNYLSLTFPFSLGAK